MTDEKVYGEEEAGVGAALLYASPYLDELGPLAVSVAVAGGVALIGDGTYKVSRLRGVDRREAMESAVLAGIGALTAAFKSSTMDNILNDFVEQVGRKLGLDEILMQRLRAMSKMQSVVLEQSKDQAAGDKKEDKGLDQNVTTWPAEQFNDAKRKVPASQIPIFRVSAQRAAGVDRVIRHRELAPHRTAAAIGRAGGFSIAPISGTRRVAAGLATANRLPGANMRLPVRPGAREPIRHFAERRRGVFKNKSISQRRHNHPVDTSTKQRSAGAGGRLISDRFGRAQMATKASLLGQRLLGRQLSVLAKRTAKKRFAGADSESRRNAKIIRVHDEAAGAGARSTMSRPARRKSPEIPRVAPTSIFRRRDNVAFDKGKLLDVGEPSRHGPKSITPNTMLKNRLSDGGGYSGLEDQGPATLDDRALSRALCDILDRQARLPPAGITGFDPRLSPAWPGLKIYV